MTWKWLERFPGERMYRFYPIRKSGNQESTNLLQPADIVAPKQSWTLAFEEYIYMIGLSREEFVFILDLIQPVNFLNLEFWATRLLLNKFSKALF